MRKGNLNKSIFIIGYFLFVAFIFVKFYELEKTVMEMPQEEFDSIVKHNSDILEYARKSIISEGVSPSGNTEEKEIPIPFVEELSSYQVHKLQLFIDKLDHPEKLELFSLFKYLSAGDVRQLLEILSKLTDKRADYLLQLVLSLPVNTQRDLIDVFRNIKLYDLNKLLYVMRMLDQHFVETLLSVLVSTNSLDKYIDVIIELSISDSGIVRLFNVLQSLPVDTRDNIITTFLDLPYFDIIGGIYLLDTLNNNQIQGIFKLLPKLSKEDLGYAFRYFRNISKDHARRAVDMILKDKRLLSGGVQFSRDYLDELKLEDRYVTLERAIDTGSRTSEENRYDGLTKTLNHREVDLRRMYDNLDSNREVYNGTVIDHLVHDYDKIFDKTKFVNIIGSEKVVIYGTDMIRREVTSERKLIRIQETYKKEVDKRDSVLEYMDKHLILFDYIKEKDIED